MALGRTRAGTNKSASATLSSIFFATAAALSLFVSLSNIILPIYYGTTFTPAGVTSGIANLPQERERLNGRLDTMAKSNEVKCHEHGGDCRGFFQYSGPNHSPNSTQLLQEESAAYVYGAENNNDGHLIFFPSETKSNRCIEEWMNSKDDWGSNGMSRSREDRVIFETFFRDISFGNHFYMEIGANDGVRESNTRFFDLCLGWQGLLVEPNPKNFQHVERLRPNAHHLGVAPSCNSSDVVMFGDHYFTNAQTNEEGGTIEVHCGPLWFYLEQIGISHIDFWSLDVEGAEIDILKTVDFEKVQIDVIISESVNRLEGTAERAEAVRVFLRQKGYLILQSISVENSDTFLHKSVCHRYEFPECKQ